MWRRSTVSVIAVAAVTVITFLGLGLAHANNQNAQLRVLLEKALTQRLSPLLTLRVTD